MPGWKEETRTLGDVACSRLQGNRNREIKRTRKQNAWGLGIGSVSSRECLDAPAILRIETPTGDRTQIEIFSLLEKEN